MSDTHLEIERTYDLPDGVPAPDLVGVASIVGVGSEDHYDLDATYWDTDRFDLVASRVTVRRRTGGSDAGWHIKRAASDTVRHEQHFPLTADTDHVPDEILAALRVERRGRALRPVLRIETVRRATTFVDGAGHDVAELADDSVTATRLDVAAPATPERWREVEVETIGSDETAAERVIRALDKRFETIGAHPARVASKLARGLRGADVARLRTAEKPQKGSAARVLQKRLRRLRSALLEQQRAVVGGDDIDVHAVADTTLGVAAVLTAYRQAFVPGDRTDRAVDVAGSIAEDAARASLADHLADRLHRASSPAQEALVDAVARDRIVADARGRRVAAIEHVRAALLADGVFELLDVLDDAVERSEPTAWALRSPKKVAQDVVAVEKPNVRSLVRLAAGDDDATADPAGTEQAWRAASLLLTAIEFLGDDAYPHALWRRVSVAARVLTDRVHALQALDRLRSLAVVAAAAGESTFAYGVLAGDRVRIAEESSDEAVQAFSRF